MVKNCTLRTLWDGDDLRTGSQGTQFPASQTGILWPTVVAGEVDVGVQHKVGGRESFGPGLALEAVELLAVNLEHVSDF